MTRRDFIVSATLAFVAPAIHLSPLQQPFSDKSEPSRFHDQRVERSR